MLKRMKSKPDFGDYTFAECCLYIAMNVGACAAFLGLLLVCIIAIANHSFTPLWWLCLFAPLEVVSCAGMMYVTGD